VLLPAAALVELLDKLGVRAAGKYPRACLCVPCDPSQTAFKRSVRLTELGDLELRGSRAGYIEIWSRGAVWARDRPLMLHQWLGFARHPEIEGRRDVAHLCGRRSCVNPAHLKPMTHAANMAGEGALHPVPEVQYLP
jgi:hypothetical protein